MNAESENASLYVGDLSKYVTEKMLYEKLSCVGFIDSISICRKLETKESLGYAYVNCRTKLDAERILTTMNYEYLKGKPMRIMWVEDDPSSKSISSNVIIKNLHKGIDTRVLFDTFSHFGNIVSCKIPTDEHGRPKSYGFIHFETEEEANFTIEKVNGKLMLNKKVTVEKYMSRNEIKLKSLEKKVNVKKYESKMEMKLKSQEEKENEFVDVTKNTNFTDVCIKNFSDKMGDDDLYNLFSKFGEITSHKIMRKRDGKSRGFGFVNFKDSSSAESAVLHLNKTEVGGKVLFVKLKEKKERRKKV